LGNELSKLSACVVEVGVSHDVVNARPQFPDPRQHGFKVRAGLEGGGTSQICTSQAIAEG
jgi:hypothetical protein